jgi:DNA modification methylase
MGSGSTLVAAVQTGRNGIGCDNNEEYYAIAKKRIEHAEKHTGKIAKPKAAKKPEISLNTKQQSLFV